MFENMVVADVMKSRLNRGQYPRLFFLRTGKGFEIDLIVQEGRSLHPMEIKSASTFNATFVANLQRFCKSEPEAKSPLLICDGESYPEREGVSCLNDRQRN